MASSSRKHRTSGKKRAPSRGNPAKVPTRHINPPTAADWIGAARLRTLPLAVSPVLAGTGAAHLVDVHLHWVMALGCLLVAVFLQIGVNYANDYSDGVRGTDDTRVGPARLTASHRVHARTVLIVALSFFAAAGVVGLAMVIAKGQWWMLVVGAACILAAWYYTGGKHPYGYHGLGELFVFVFFGPVATVGTTWIQVQAAPQEAWFAGVGVGLLAVAVLLANNLRDIEQDRAAGKRTLSVLVGRRGTQVLFTLCVVVAFGIAAFLALFYPVAWLVMMALLGGIPALLIVWAYREHRELVVVLILTSMTSLAYGALLMWAFFG